MPTLDDLPTLPTLSTPALGDFIPVYDVSADNAGPSAVKKLTVGQLNGLFAGDVTIDTDGGTITLTTRVLLITGGSASAVTVPLPSGDLRELFIMNGGSGNATVAVSGNANVFKEITGLTADSSVVLTTGTTARLLSDGTFWYRI